jgi:hypothetical protein
MLVYNVILKGLKFGEDVYEEIPIQIQAETEREIDDLITDAIYKVRLDNLYYKMKYISKVKCDETECNRSTE